jgi:hypothetical protein
LLSIIRPPNQSQEKKKKLLANYFKLKLISFVPIIGSLLFLECVFVQTLCSVFGVCLIPEMVFFTLGFFFFFFGGCMINVFVCGSMFLSVIKCCFVCDRCLYVLIVFTRYNSTGC